MSTESFDSVQSFTKKDNIRLYRVWRDMKTRCYNPNYHAFKHYGGRGIKVCDDWKDSFQEFGRWAMDNGYDPLAPFGKCTLDRIDVNGDYEPSNCRWVSFKTQRANRRKFQNVGSRPVYALDESGNIVMEYPSVKEAARKTGLCAPDITAVCKGRDIHAGGFAWRHKYPTHEEESETRKRIQAHEEVTKKWPLPVCVVDESGNVTERYSSLREAARITGCSRILIKKVCDGLAEMTHGKRFVYG